MSQFFHHTNSWFCLPPSKHEHSQRSQFIVTFYLLIDELLPSHRYITSASDSSHSTSVCLTYLRSDTFKIKHHTVLSETLQTPVCSNVIRYTIKQLPKLRSSYDKFYGKHFSMVIYGGDLALKVSSHNKCSLENIIPYCNCVDILQTRPELACSHIARALRTYANHFCLKVK
jgi:hypothetical protein